MMAGMWALSSANAGRGWSARVTTAAGCGGVLGQGEVEEPWWLGELQGAQDGLLAGCGRGALGDPAVVGGQGDQVQPVQFVAGVGPGVGGAVLDDPDEQQRRQHSWTWARMRSSRWWKTGRSRSAPSMSRQPRSTATSCL